VLQLASGGADEDDVLGQQRPAELRMRMPLTRHERMFVWTDHDMNRQCAVPVV
jgi:hypothetical protein